MTPNTLAICVATMNRPLNAEFNTGTLKLHHPDVSTWFEHAAIKAIPVHFWFNDNVNLGVVGAYQKLYKTADADVLLFLHDDVICREQDWDLRLMAEFISDEQVAVVGLGGALWHGLPELYKVPYQLQQLQRGDYRSNVDDAEVHGERFTDSCNVAVLDGFAMAVRRSFLDRIGGWSKLPEHSSFYCYDYILCALARRYHQKVRLLGIRCHHRGGQSSTKVNTIATSDESYRRSHEWFYQSFRDVMPCSVKP